MVDWSKKENLTENPATKHISYDDLLKIGTGEKNLTEFIPKVISHSIGKKHAINGSKNITLIKYIASL